MENAFASFEPIQLNSSPTREEIARQYQTNNVVLENDYLNDLFGLNKPTSLPVAQMSTSPVSYNIKDILRGTIKPAAKPAAISSTTPTTTPKNKIVDEIQAMDVSDEDKDFLIKMAQAESGFQPYITNTLGYYGLYQFGKPALQSVGMTKKDFDITLNQHKAALKLADQNEKTNKRLFDKYVGTVKDGVLITRNGLRAAHALLGAGGVREWLEGGNKTWTAQHSHKDAYGTGPEKYLRMFV
jgi:hypothetical protein